MKLKKNEMDRICDTHQRNKNCFQNLIEEYYGKDLRMKFWFKYEDNIEMGT
jgi:hypothetical protein